MTTNRCIGDTKTCSKCGIEKPLGDFYRDKRNRDGHHSRCRTVPEGGHETRVCRTQRRARYQEQRELRAKGFSRCFTCKEIKPLEEGFYRNENLSTGWTGECRACVCARSFKRQQADPEAYGRRHKAWRDANPEKAAANGRKAASRRRALKRDAFVEHVDPFVVFDRDDGRCGLCNELVPRDRFDVDHVIPLALGGEHSYENVRLAHVSCNRRRGRLAADDAALVAA